MFNATFIFKAYCKYRLNNLKSKDPHLTQKTELLGLINKAKDTKFGKDHNFDSIKSIEEYQKNVPLRTYEQFWNDYLKPFFPIVENIIWPGKIPFFAVSSGTTSGSTKYIPYTSEMTASNTKAGMDLLVHHIANKPNSNILAGKSFMLGGSTNLVEQSPGIFSGDLSGIAVKTMKPWARPWYFPPANLALLENWEEKIDLLAKASIKEDIRMLSGVPTWLLIFLDKIADLKGKDKPAYENLEMLVHGGVPFGPYFDRFNSIFDRSKVDFREVYPASEGFIALADKGYGEGLRLLYDHGNFFEFVPANELESKNPTRHWVGNIQKGINYAVVISSCAGLWSYILGDTIEFIETNPPRLLITGRTAFYLSAFGEHVIADEIEQAVNQAAKTSNIQVDEYTVGALFPKNSGDLGQHLFIVESSTANPSSQAMVEFCNTIDIKLSELNEDYKAHRAGGFGLKAPSVKVIKPGTFMAWMKSRGKLGGQNKIPRIIAKTELFNDLIDFTNKTI